MAENLLVITTKIMLGAFLAGLVLAPRSPLKSWTEHLKRSRRWALSRSATVTLRPRFLFQELTSGR